MVSLRVLVDRRIPELEVSITARCTLACKECGFLVPDQPSPALGDPVDELAGSLRVLRDAGVRIGSLAVLGGEPTLHGPLLERAVVAFRALDVAERIEVVSNGLTPRGLTPTAARTIDRLTVSDYGLAPALLARWREWLALVAPAVEFIVRSTGDGWDAWTTVRSVSAERAQGFYEDCWYRRHCATVERGRLFACSRVAKLARDDEGLPLTGETTMTTIEAWMHRPEALPSCRSCTPMMNLLKVAAGVQPDERLAALESRALAWLDVAIASAKGVRT
jgi:hypothetical protein